jgi:NAD(P)H-flavin reductase
LIFSRGSCPKHRKKFAGGLYFNVLSGKGYVKAPCSRFVETWRLPTYTTRTVPASSVHGPVAAKGGLLSSLFSRGRDRGDRGDVVMVSTSPYTGTATGESGFEDCGCDTGELEEGYSGWRLVSVAPVSGDANVYRFQRCDGGAGEPAPDDGADDTLLAWHVSLKLLSGDDAHTGAVVGTSVASPTAAAAAVHTAAPPAPPSSSSSAPAVSAATDSSSGGVGPGTGAGAGAGGAAAATAAPTAPPAAPPAVAPTAGSGGAVAHTSTATAAVSSTGARAVSRDYTPVSGVSEWRRGVLDLLIKVYPDGELTSRLPPMQLGTVVHVSGPEPTITPASLSMVPDRPASGEPLSVAMVVGGTGIAPALQLLRRALGAGSQFPVGSRFWLLDSNHREEDILLRADIDAAAATHPQQLRVAYTLTRGAPPDWRGFTGRVDASMRAWLFSGAAEGDVIPPQRWLVLCGPQGMLTEVSRDVVADGIVPADRVIALEA